MTFEIILVHQYGRIMKPNGSFVQGYGGTSGTYIKFINNRSGSAITHIRTIVDCYVLNYDTKNLYELSAGTNFPDFVNQSDITKSYGNYIAWI